MDSPVLEREDVRPSPQQLALALRLITPLIRPSGTPGDDPGYPNPRAVLAVPARIDATAIVRPWPSMLAPAARIVQETTVAVIMAILVVGLHFRVLHPLTPGGR